MWSKITRHWIYAKNSLLIFCCVFFSSLSSRELTNDDRLTLEKKKHSSNYDDGGGGPRVQKSLGDILRPQSVCCVRHLSLICTLRAGSKKRSKSAAAKESDQSRQTAQYSRARASCSTCREKWNMNIFFASPSIVRTFLHFTIGSVWCAHTRHNTHWSRVVLGWMWRFELTLNFFLLLIFHQSGCCWWLSRVNDHG